MNDQPRAMQEQKVVKPLKNNDWGVRSIILLSLFTLGVLTILGKDPRVLAQVGNGRELPKVLADTHPTPVQDNSPSPRETPMAQPAIEAGEERFFCQLWNGQYTVMYRPASHPQEVFPWAVPKDLGGGWLAQKRCHEISRRLEDYRPDGLQELTTTTDNGYDIVCATTQINPTCRIVFTVPPGQDAITTRDAVFENLTVADRGTITQGVNTFVGNSRSTVNLNDDLVNLGLSLLGGGSTWVNSTVARSAINLRPHLDPADGGTGVHITNGIPIPQKILLNPERFR
jgi:hypothetical protein